MMQKTIDKIITKYIKGMQTYNHKNNDMSFISIKEIKTINSNTFIAILNGTNKKIAITKNSGQPSDMDKLFHSGDCDNLSYYNNLYTLVLI